MRVSDMIESLSKLDQDAELGYSVTLQVIGGAVEESKELEAVVAEEVAPEAPVEAVEPSVAPEVVAE